MKEIIKKIEEMISEYEEVSYPYNFLEEMYSNYLEQINQVIETPELLLDNPNMSFRMFMLLICKDKDIEKWASNYAFLGSNIYKDIERFTSDISLTEFLVTINHLDKTRLNNLLKYIAKVFEIIEIIVDDNKDGKNLINGEKAIKKEKISTFFDKNQDMIMFSQLVMLISEKTKMYLTGYKRAEKLGIGFYELEHYRKQLGISDSEIGYAYILMSNVKNNEDIQKFLTIVKRNLDKDLIMSIADCANLESVVRIDLNFPKKYVDRMSRVVRVLKANITALENEKNSFDNMVVRNIDILNKLKNKLQTYTNSDYIYVNDFNWKVIDKLEEFILKEELLAAIYVHNQQIFRSLQLENSQNSNDAYDNIAAKYQLPYHFSDDVKTVSSSDVDLIIQALLDAKISEVVNDKEKIEYIVKYSDYSKVNVIIGFANHFHIPTDFLMEHIDIFGDRYTIFTENALLIKNENIQITNIDILLSNPKELAKKIQLVLAYNINLRKNSNNNDKFLSDSKCFDYFDQYIELGYYGFIRNHLPYCQEKNENILKRLSIASTLDIDVMEDKELNKDITNEKNFLIPDFMLDDYLINDVDSFDVPLYRELFDNSENVDLNLNIKIIQTLDDKYKVSEYEYNINGVIISRIKVIRYLTTLLNVYKDENIHELLFNAIIHNSVLSYVEIEGIKESLYANGLMYKLA